MALSKAGEDAGIVVSQSYPSTLQGPPPALADLPLSLLPGLARRWQCGAAPLEYVQVDLLRAALEIEEEQSAPIKGLRVFADYDVLQVVGFV
jgi:hypothetical protein